MYKQIALLLASLTLLPPALAAPQDDGCACSAKFAVWKCPYESPGRWTVSITANPDPPKDGQCEVPYFCTDKAEDCKFGNYAVTAKNTSGTSQSVALGSGTVTGDPPNTTDPPKGVDETDPPGGATQVVNRGKSYSFTLDGRSVGCGSWWFKDLSYSPCPIPESECNGYGPCSIANFFFICEDCAARNYKSPNEIPD